ncbi:uncharacterized protein M6B38_135870 [Iris pallida]|uniref:Uncharacterized protein n=1 Tax=Iris pallida TaxID=29817 RepID=A0AAX6FGB8_IRIPA|nr:uncharacterized protein M6B38_135870 [Iris pallida]
MSLLSPSPTSLRPPTNHQNFNPSSSSTTLIPPKPPNFLSPNLNKRLSPRLPSISTSTTSSPTTTTTSTIPQETLLKDSTPHSHPNWTEFAERASGEWDGFGADFTAEGAPLELPENVVPEAFREWEVRVFDWQTQCPTLASESEAPDLSYKLIRLLPTVGCEADAATRHSMDERTARTASAFAYAPNGCYAAVWPMGKGGLEVEHCFVDPGNVEARVRVVMVVKEGEGEGLRLEGIRVFSEQWYGPWRNGEQLGGCAVRESGFAEGPKLDVSKLVGVWEGRSVRLAGFCSECKDAFHELVEAKPQKKVRDQDGVVALPKNIWCSFKEEDGETCGEVGWLLDNGQAMTSRCVFLKDGKLKARDGDCRGNCSSNRHTIITCNLSMLQHCKTA